MTDEEHTIAEISAVLDRYYRKKAIKEGIAPLPPVRKTIADNPDCDCWKCLIRRYERYCAGRSTISSANTDARNIATTNYKPLPLKDLRVKPLQYAGKDDDGGHWYKP